MSHARTKPRTKTVDGANAYVAARLRESVPLYEVSGPPTAPVVVALGGISASRHVTSTIGDDSVGWWQNTVGAGRAIDSAEYRVLSFDYVDAGSTEDGRPEALISTHDQADALRRVLDAICVEKVHAIVGASYGGMVALAFADRYPDRVERIVIVSAPHEAHPMSTALRSIQRGIVTLGLDTGRTHDALSLARALAMTTYRSASEFAGRFSPLPDVTTDTTATFPVENYLIHHGEKFARGWDPGRFLALSLSADLHRIDPRRIHTPAVLVSIDGDTIVPAEQMEQLAAVLAGPHRLIRVQATTGHDAFLAEPDIIGPILSNALRDELIA